MNKKTARLLLATAIAIPNPLAGGGVHNFGDLLTKIISGAGTLIVSLGTIMIIIAGILYVTSAGDQGRMGTAKTALLYAVGGIALGTVAHLIVIIIKGILGVPAT